MVALAVLVMAFPVSGWATTVIIPITNSSFENVSPHAPLSPNGAVGYVVGWQGGGGTWYATSSYYPTSPSYPYYPNIVPDGHNVAYLGNTSISQLVSAYVQVGHQYDLNVWVGDPYTAASQYTVALVATDIHGADTTLTFSSGAPPTHHFAEVQLQYIATSQFAGDQLKIVLTSTSNHEVDFDKVSLTDTSSVPTPSTLLLLGSGLFGLGFLRLRRKARQ